MITINRIQSLEKETWVFVKAPGQKRLAIDPVEIVQSITGVELTREYCIMNMAWGMRILGNQIRILRHRGRQEMFLEAPPLVLRPEFVLVGMGLSMSDKNFRRFMHRFVERVTPEMRPEVLHNTAVLNIERALKWDFKKEKKFWLQIWGDDHPSVPNIR